MPLDKSGNPRSGFARAGHADKVMAERGGKSEGKAAMAKPKMEGAGADKGTNVSHMGIEEVVKHHGPAHAIHESHDEEANVHTVTSHHAKGHVHHSEHGSRDEAHAHSGKASGIGLQQEDDAYDGEETPQEEMAEQKQSIPGMA